MRVHANTVSSSTCMVRYQWFGVAMTYLLVVLMISCGSIDIVNGQSPFTRFLLQVGPANAAVITTSIAIDSNSNQTYIHTSYAAFVLNGTKSIKMVPNCTFGDIAVYPNNHSVLVSCSESNLNQSDSSLIAYDTTTGSQVTVLTGMTCSFDSIGVDSLSGRIYALCRVQDTVIVYDRSVTTELLHHACPGASGMVVDSARDSVYVQCVNGFVRISISTNVVTMLRDLGLPGCGSPGDIELDQRTGNVFLACDSGGLFIWKNDEAGGGELTQLVTKADCFIQGGRGGSDGASMAVDQRAGILYASCGATGGILGVVGHSTFRLVPPASPVVTVAEVVGLGVNDRTHAVFMGDRKNGIIAASVTLATNILITSVCPDPYDVVIIGNTTFVACATGALWSVTANIVEPIFQCSNMMAIEWHPVMNRLLVVCTSMPAGSHMDPGVIAVNLENGAYVHVLTQDDCVYPITVKYNSATQVTAIGCIDSSTPNDGGVWLLGPDGTTKIKALDSPPVLSLAWSTPTTLAVGTNMNGLLLLTIKQDMTSGVWNTSSIRTLLPTIICNAIPTLDVILSTNQIVVGCSNSVYAGWILLVNSTGPPARFVVPAIMACIQPTKVFWSEEHSSILVACQGQGLTAVPYKGIVNIPSEASPAYQQTWSYPFLTQDQCASPRGMVFNSLTRDILVACSGSGLLSVSTWLRCPSGFSLGSGEVGCLSCSVGRFRNLDMILTNEHGCAVCPIGSVAPLAGASACQLCTTGQYAASPLLPCQPCANGTYSSSDGATVCLACDAGYYGDASGTSSQCSGPCDSGYWCSAGSTSPRPLKCGARSVYCPLNSTSPIPVSLGFFSNISIDGTDATMSIQSECMRGNFCDGSGVMKSCYPGTYADQTGLAICTDCPVSTKQPSAGASDCEPCPPGQISRNVGAAYCTACQPGQQPYMTVTGPTCQACQPGTYSVNGVKCLPCPSGQVASNAGSAYCTSCQPGHQPDVNLLSGLPTCLSCLSGSASSNGTICLPCSAGRFSSIDGSLICTDCIPGEYQPDVGMTFCSICDSGKFSRSYASTGCSNCTAGEYSSASQSSSCFACAPGSASDIIGLNTIGCPQCAKGEYQSDEGQTKCIRCGIRAFSSSIGSLQCETCTGVLAPDHSSCTFVSCPAETRYSDVTGMCETCPLGMTSSGGGQSSTTDEDSNQFGCQSCPMNTYTPYAGSGCISCTQSGMDGIECSNGLARVKSGYWAYQSKPSSGTNQSYGIYQTAQCPTGYCQGGALQQQPKNSTDYDPDELQPQCEYPRANTPDNALCGGCVDGYIVWNGICTTCSSVNGGLVFGLLILSFALVLFLIRSTASASSAGTTVILLYFIQLSVLQMGPVAGWLNWLRFTNFDGGSSFATCLGPMTVYEQVLLALLTPIIFLMELGVISILHRIRNNENIRLGRMHTFSWSRYAGVAISILLFCYTQVATTCLQYLSCTEVGDMRVVFSQPTIDCDSDTYRSYRVVVILFLTFYIIGMPMSVLAFLFYRRHARVATSTIHSVSAPSDESSVAEAHAKAFHSSLSFVKRYGSLFTMYRTEAWYWQVSVLFRRLLFVIISVQLVERPGLKCMSFALINVAALLMQISVRPFASELFNQLESSAHVFLLVIAIVLTEHKPPYTTDVQIILFLLILPFVLLLIGLTIWSKAKGLATIGRQNPTKQVDALTANPVSNGKHDESLDVSHELHKQKDVSDHELTAIELAEVNVPENGSTASSWLPANDARSDDDRDAHSASL